MPNVETITLTPIEREILEFLIANSHKEVNTLGLRKLGILHPTNAISSLRKKGAIIEVYLKDHKPLFQKGYKRLGHYIYKGWRDE